MTKQKFLSQKKTVCQSFSLSPALKEWMRRYVRVKNKKFPDEDQFKSVSAFISSLLIKEMTHSKNKLKLRD